MSAPGSVNALVAEKIMGWEDNWANPGSSSFPHMWGIMDWYSPTEPARASNFPAYDDDIAATYEVIEQALTDGFEMALAIRREATHVVVTKEGKVVGAATAKSAPYAINVAALKAYGVEVE